MRVIQYLQQKPIDIKKRKRRDLRGEAVDSEVAKVDEIVKVSGDESGGNLFIGDYEVLDALWSGLGPLEYINESMMSQMRANDEQRTEDNKIVEESETNEQLHRACDGNKPSK